MHDLLIEPLIRVEPFVELSSAGAISRAGADRDAARILVFAPTRKTLGTLRYARSRVMC